MSELSMTEADMILSFKRSANPSKHAGVLAALNACNKDIIIEILYRHGLVDIKGIPIIKGADGVDGVVKDKRSRTYFNDEMIYKMALLVSEGKTHEYIANELNVDHTSVRNALNRRGITHKTVSQWLSRYSDDNNSTPPSEETTLQPASTADFQQFSMRVDLLCELSEKLYLEFNPILFGRLYQVLQDLREQVELCL